MNTGKVIINSVLDFLWLLNIIESIAAEEGMSARRASKTFGGNESNKRLFYVAAFLYMPLTKQKKEEILKELKGQAEKSDLIVFVNFHGLSTILSRELRSLIKKANSKYFVAKKTLIKRALDGFNFSGEMPKMDGEVALVFGKDDVVEPVKILTGFRKKNPQINLLGGVVEGIFVGKEAMADLAKLPGREVLIAQFLNVISAPTRGLVGVLSGAQRDFVSVLSQINKNNQ